MLPRGCWCRQCSGETPAETPADAAADAGDIALTEVALGEGEPLRRSLSYLMAIHLLQKCF